MELPKITGFLWFYLTILLAFGQVLTAQGPTGEGEWELPAEPTPAADSLQIKLDRDLYKKQGSIVYASHLEFDETPDISDSQLCKIARDAYNEMRGMATKNGLTEKIPNVMTTLLIGKELIFASSAKGRAEPVDEDSQVQGDLSVCSQANEGRRHKNGGRCGEVMAFHEWYESHVRSGPLDNRSSAKVVAISMQKNAAGKREPLILAPCGNDKDWGCNKFVNGVYVLDDAKVAADPQKAAFRYKNMIKNKKLKPAATRPVGPPPSHLPPPPGRKPNSKPGGSNQGDNGPPPNRLPPPPGGRPNRKPNSNPGGNTSNQGNDGPPPANDGKPPRKPTGGKPKMP